MNRHDPLAIVESWQEAANDGDVERLVGLSSPDIELVGPRGKGSGHRLLREWMARAGLTLRTVRAYMRGEIVVLAQHGVWRAVETGAVQGEGDVASRFRVEGGAVVQVARHETLEAALAEAGLNPSDEVGP